MKYIITSGWWCDGTGTHGGLPLGSTRTRQVNFFYFWMSQILKYTNPIKIFITDSASPIKPNIKIFTEEDEVNFNVPFKNIEWVSTHKNFLHAANMDINDNLSGVMRSILLGAFYTLMNNIDYFVYIEQDCIIHGDKIIEGAIKNMRGYDYSHGLRKERSHKCEISFLIFRKEAIMTFIKHIMSYKKSDREYIPELKFKDLKDKLRYKALPFGYGRDRPINFNKPHYYFQHATEKELARIGYEMG